MLGRLIRSLVQTSTNTAAPAQDVPGATANRPFVAFVTTVSEPRFVGPGDRLNSGLGSTRLRVLIPAAELAGQVPVALVPLDAFLADPTLASLGTAQAIVLGKVSTDAVVSRAHELSRLLELLRTRKLSIPVYADVSDDYAAMATMVGIPNLADYERGLAECCVLTVPCAALAERLAGRYGRPVHVIEDPWESARTNPPKAPRVSGGQLRLCWFGNITSYTLPPVEEPLRRVVERLKGVGTTLEFVTSANRRDIAEALGDRLRAIHPGLDFRYLAWSREATWEALDRCDLVLLPQDHASDWGRVKSHNRLVEAIRAGRLALASPIPSYLELADFAWVGEDLAEGVTWALENPEAAVGRLARGQAQLGARFAPQAVAAKWATVLGLAAASPPAAEQAPPGGRDAADAAGVVRLNLGCGDKILPGYVNVDIAASRAGRRPDVQCDLHRLEPFASDSADEVMAIHVVEHFWRWEVVDVLKEWTRVLRPGGRMVLECPNLLTACKVLLEDPAAGALPGREGQRTMWVLYGDPAWRDPLMCHRWNYTPQSLADVMREAGLVNIRQEPAQFKLREPRDMRVVGEKPAPRA